MVMGTLMKVKGKMFKMKKCIWCREKMDKNALICPNCGRNQIKPWFKFMCFFVIFCSVFYLIYMVFYTTFYEFFKKNIYSNYSNYADNDNSNYYIYPDSKETTVTLQEFDSIKIGMTYDEIVTIIGGECTLMSESNYSSFNSKMYGCNGSTIGSDVILNFLNDKLEAKSQFGLK